jgi:hypothetical protein
MIANNQSKQVQDPCGEYEDLKYVWAKSRAICNGERHTKAYDLIIDRVNFTNILIPFSPTMSDIQYNFYKAEAELPGLVSQYARIIVGGLLRKPPQIEFPEGLPEGAEEWIKESFSQDEGTLLTFLDNSLWEEVQTSRCWVYVDHPAVNTDDMTPEQKDKVRPYPVIWNAESIINWKVGLDPETKMEVLQQVIVHSYTEDFSKNEFHPEYISTLHVHELVDGKYQVRVYMSSSEDKGSFQLKDTITRIEMNGERLTHIPAYPLNGSIDTVEPFLMTLVDREISLYNKVSRRNHLLYGAATYTPVISASITDDQFDEIVQQGLGTWIKLNSGDTIDVLKPPTESLKDMESAIAATIDEMSKMGIRLLAPETDQSGVALEIRNAAQTAQLGSLNARISSQMSNIICFMLNWKYGTEYDPTEIKFNLSADFNPAPLGVDWLRLVTEWYQSGILPRSIFLEIAKQNDIIPPDYNDEEGQEEVNQDDMVMGQREQMDYQLKMKAAAQNGKPKAKP